MATISKWTPFGVSLSVTATSGTVTRTSATQYTVKLNVSWKTYWDGAQTNYGMTASSGGSSVTINKFGTKASSGSGTLTGTYSISGNNAATKTITVTFRNFNNDNGDSATTSINLSVSVPKWTSYTVSYNANGGSGAPAAQTKWKDQTLTLSNTVPTRTGYTFMGWSTTKQTAIDGSATVNYNSGASYTANSSTTLYAVWKAYTYQVIYNANGGTGAPSAQTKVYGVTLTLSGTRPTRTNYEFKGWGTSASATAPVYSPGGTYTSNAKITLYAIWELAYRKPRVTEFTAIRCNSNGSANDSGTYVKVSFRWTVDASIQTISIVCNSATGSTVDFKNYEMAGLNEYTGTVEEVIGSGKLNAEQSYTIMAVVKDSGDTSGTTKSATLGGIKYAIDFKAGAKGVAFGKPAEINGYADYAFDVLLNNNLAIAGRNTNGDIMKVFHPMDANGDTLIGYDHWYWERGDTYLYGYDVHLGVGALTDAPYRPYCRKGDTITFSNLRTAGYVTNSGADVTFLIPFAVPIIGNPTVTVTSNNGFVLRQNEKYTHGSASDTYVFPNSYTGTVSKFCGIYVVAKFSNITNVVNNSPIGIYWSGTITFT